MTDEENRLNVARYNKKVSEAISKMLAIRGELLAFAELFREQPVIESRVVAHARAISAAVSNMDNMRPMIYMLEEDVRERVQVSRDSGKRRK